MFKIFNKKDKVNSKKAADDKPLDTLEQSAQHPTEDHTKEGIEAPINTPENQTGTNNSDQLEEESKPEQSADIEKPAAKKTSWFSRLKQGLGKTRQNFSSGVGQLFKNTPKLDDETLEELETHLLLADIGIEATEEIIEKLKTQAKAQKIHEGEALIDCLKSVMTEVLTPCDEPLVIPEQATPFIILMVGINGAGKTTTIGKLTKQLQAQGKSVMLAAGDTFRAAAIEQLQAWGERHNTPVVAQHSGADSASVIYDAIQSATAKNMDVLIADTAGRLHTQQGLMGELEKVKRVIQKLDPNAPHETMLVLDASIGQNALQQAKEFGKAVDISGITMTKLDGTAKGGILFAIAQQLKTPVRFIGVGENAEDLQRFKASAFVDAIFSTDNT